MAFYKRENHEGKIKIQAIETRKKIYETAKKLFSKYGYDAVSIDDSVKEAGVARGSFYVYFLSKEDLSVYLMFDGLEGMQSKIKDEWNKKNLSATKLIVNIVSSICALVQSMCIETVRVVYKIFIELSATTGSSAKSLFEMPILFTNLYSLGLQRNEFIETDANTVAENIKTILVGTTLEWCLYHPNYDYIGRSKSLVSDCLNGMKHNN